MAAGTAEGWMEGGAPMALPMEGATEGAMLAPEEG